MQDVMLDLETMGNGPDAAIIAVGAVAFDVDSKTLGDEFYRAVNLKSSVDIGGVMDPDTVMWWMRQSNEARSAFERAGHNIAHVLVHFAEWMRSLGEESQIRVWGNGAAFDNTILASAYRKAGIERPWRFWNDRCYRTMKNMHPEVNLERVGTYHNAVDDAKSQALHLLKML